MKETKDGEVHSRIVPEFYSKQQFWGVGGRRGFGLLNLQNATTSQCIYEHKTPHNGETENFCFFLCMFSRTEEIYVYNLSNLGIPVS